MVHVSVTFSDFAVSAVLFFVDCQDIPLNLFIVIVNLCSNIDTVYIEI